MRAAADVGGTFTDVLLQLPAGEIAYHKVLSSPPAYDVAVVDGVAELLGARRGGRSRRSCTGRRWRRTRCSSAAARALRS